MGCLRDEEGGGRWGGWNYVAAEEEEKKKPGARLSSLGIVVSGGNEGRRNMVDWQPATISIRFLSKE